MCGFRAFNLDILCASAQTSPAFFSPFLGTFWNIFGRKLIRAAAYEGAHGAGLSSVHGYLHPGEITMTTSSARVASHAVSTYRIFRSMHASFPEMSSRQRRHAVAAGLSALLLWLGAFCAPAYAQNVAFAG